MRHADPLLVGPRLTSAHVGLDRCGDVRRPRVRVQFRVKVWRRVDDQLDRSGGLPGCVRRDARKLSRILENIGNRRQDATFTLVFQINGYKIHK